MVEKQSSRRLKDVLRRTAPELARALGGPLAGVAVEAAARAILGDGRGDVSLEDLADAIELASPEARLKLRLAAIDFRAKLAEAAAQEERIAASDRADARARERALQDRAPGALAVVVVAGFFGVLLIMMLGDVPDGAETEFSIMLGALATMAAAVMNYYFGSSAGSREKTHLLERRSQPPWT